MDFVDLKEVALFALTCIRSAVPGRTGNGLRVRVEKSPVKSHSMKTSNCGAGDDMSYGL